MAITQGNYNYTKSGSWIGGHFEVPNSSTGYHAILKQWWDAHKKNNSTWLLVSEKNDVKPYFISVYPRDTFVTLELYAKASESDFIYDICRRDLTLLVPKFDIVVCQATLEHIYDPFGAMCNMASLLHSGGILSVHTHTINPEFPYHAFPRDYIRFYKDWFEDIPKYMENTKLIELYEAAGHIFTLYRKE